MRIIGGHDYYDHGLAYGVDESIVFVRTGRELSGEDLHTWGWAPIPKLTLDRPPKHRKFWHLYKPEQREWTHGNLDYSYDRVLVFLCGYVYVGARVSWKASQTLFRLAPGQDFGDVEGSETFWDQNTLGKFLAGKGAHLNTDTSERKKRNEIARKKGWNYDLRPFERSKLEGEQLSRMIETGVVVATHVPENQHHDENKRKYIDFWRMNEDTLKEYFFIKVMDPVRAFQEISMWVGGVLPSSGNPMVEITDDKIKVAKHGMDKWSFRTKTEKSR